MRKALRNSGRCADPETWPVELRQALQTRGMATELQRLMATAVVSSDSDSRVTTRRPPCDSARKPPSASRNSGRLSTKRAWPLASPRQIEPCPLSTREIEVLILIARGGSTRQVAQQLTITPKTGPVSTMRAAHGAEELMMISASGIIIRTPLETISLQGRAAQVAGLVTKVEALAASGIGLAREAAAAPGRPRMVVFGPHTDLAAHAEARAAGIGPMLARSKLVAGIHELVARRP